MSSSPSSVHERAQAVLVAARTLNEAMAAAHEIGLEIDVIGTESGVIAFDRLDTATEIVVRVKMRYHLDD